MYDAGTTYKNSMFTFDRQMSIQVDIEYNNGLTETFTDSDSNTVDLSSGSSSSTVSPQILPEKTPPLKLKPLSFCR